MKILTITYSLSKGGVARTAATYAISYKKLDMDSRVLSFAPGGQREKDLTAAGVPCWQNMSEQTLQEILNWNPDAVHIHSHMFGDLEMQFICRIFPGRTLVEKNVFSRPVQWTKQMNYSYQLSVWCAWRFCTLAPELADKALIVPNGADSCTFARAPDDTVHSFRAEHSIPLDAPVIGRIGQHYDTKWSPVLIDAFNKLAKKYPTLHLLLVNPSKPIRRQADASHSRDHIVIIDKIIGNDALSTAYSTMDIFALAADQGESFGNVIAESLLCETPVVALSTPWQDNSQCEVVGNNIGGLIALTPKGFCRAMDTLLCDKPRREAMGKAGRERIIRNYNLLNVAQTSLDAIEGKYPPMNPKKLDRQIIEIYSNAFEKPSLATLWLLKDKRFLRFTRYTTHYWPAWKLPFDIFNLIIRKIKKA